MKTHLDGIAGLDEILTIQVRDHHLPVSILQAVQAAVAIFFEHREIGGIVLIAVGSEVAEQPHARLLVGEDESSKIAGERLNASADRNEVVLTAQVLELGFDES